MKLSAVLEEVAHLDKIDIPGGALSHFFADVFCKIVAVAATADQSFVMNTFQAAFKERE